MLLSFIIQKNKYVTDCVFTDFSKPNRLMISIKS
jgi:hypothetical protein